MKIKKAKLNDAKFIHDNLEILRGDVSYSFLKFQNFYKSFLLNENNWIYIAEISNNNVGFVTVNKYSSIRYIGYTIELEEVVIIEEMRGRGIGKQFLNLVIDRIKTDLSIRKIVIKTDDLLVAGKLFSKFLNINNMRVFQKHLNKI